MSYVLYLPLARRDIFSFFILIIATCCVIVVFICSTLSHAASLYTHTHAGLLFCFKKFLAYLVHSYKHCLSSVTVKYL